MLAGKTLKMPGKFKEIYIERGLIEDRGLVSWKKKKAKKKKNQKTETNPVIFNIFNIFFLVFIYIMTTFESNDYWILFCFW